MLRRGGNEAHTNRQGEIEADLMSVDIGAIDNWFIHIMRDGAYHTKIFRHDIYSSMRSTIRVS